MKLQLWFGQTGALLRKMGRALAITQPYRLRAPPFHVMLQTGHQRLPRRIPRPDCFRARHRVKEGAACKMRWSGSGGVAP